MKRNKKLVSIVCIVWLLVIGINVNGLKIVLPDDYHCCKKIIDPTYDYEYYKSPYACENISMSKEACQKYVDEQDKSTREMVKAYDRPALVAFFIILGILMLALIGIGTVIYWIIRSVRKSSKKQKVAKKRT